MHYAGIWNLVLCCKKLGVCWEMGEKGGKRRKKAETAEKGGQWRMRDTPERNLFPDSSWGCWKPREMVWIHTLHYGSGSPRRDKRRRGVSDLKAAQTGDFEVKWGLNGVLESSQGSWEVLRALRGLPDEYIPSKGILMSVWRQICGRVEMIGNVSMIVYAGGNDTIVIECP